MNQPEAGGILKISSWADFCQSQRRFWPSQRLQNALAHSPWAPFLPVWSGLEKGGDCFSPHRHRPVCLLPQRHEKHDGLAKSVYVFFEERGNKSWASNEKHSFSVLRLVSLFYGDHSWKRKNKCFLVTHHNHSLPDLLNSSTHSTHPRPPDPAAPRQAPKIGGG